jgi:Tfp pilus assembly protein PilX
MNAGLEAGKGVAATANQEHEAALRDAEREVKAAEKSEEERYQERRKAAAAERKAKEEARKAQEKESSMSGALPRKTNSAPQGLPVTQSGGLPRRTNSIAGATGRRAATR